VAVRPARRPAGQVAARAADAADAAGVDHPFRRAELRTGPATARTAPDFSS
jgi:hypothetical protein